MHFNGCSVSFLKKYVAYFFMNIFFCVYTILNACGNENYLLRIQPGQGNIAISYHGDLAIIYDAGVKSQQMHAKLACLAQNEPKTIFSPKKRATQFCESDACLFSSLSSSTPCKTTCLDKVATAQKETVSIDSPKKFSDALKGIKIVIYFGSHTDCDHWNLIHHIPKETAVLGIWNDFSSILGQKQADLGGFLARKNVQIFDSKKFNKSICEKKFSDFYQNDLSKKIKNEEIRKLVDDNLHDLSNIILWNLNPKSVSSNGKSYIISQTYPNANLSIFFTGDAENETFETLPNDFRKQFSSDPSHQIGIVVPHHGSKNHAAFIEKLRPNFYIVSSGNGGQYPHPHIDLIRKIDALSGADLQESTQKFWDFYNRTTCTSGCFFFSSITNIEIKLNILSSKKGKSSPAKKKGGGKKKLTRIKSGQFFRENKDGHPAILGTNFAGELFFLKNGEIAQACDFTLSAFEKSFVIDIAKRADVKSADLVSTTEENVYKLKTADVYFYKVQNNETALFYKMEEIINAISDQTESLQSEESEMSTSLECETSSLDKNALYSKDTARNLFNDDE
ncbi:MAG: hypothetical protein CNLJKLNK_00532 [Holosporales bacterium]